MFAVFFLLPVGRDEIAVTGQSQAPFDAGDPAGNFIFDLPCLGVLFLRGVSRRLLDQARRKPDVVPPLSSLLTTGGIHYTVAGATKSAVLRQVVSLLPLPPDVDREFLVTVLEAREAMGSTGIGDGIAIPHVRNPILLHVPDPFVTLCLLDHPVEFDAVDGKPVHALFSVISPTVPAHLRILAQLAVVLRDGELRRLLWSRAASETILSRVRTLEGRPSGAQVAPREPA